VRKAGIQHSWPFLPCRIVSNPVNEVVGVRIPSYASVTLTYRFGRAAK
jgi:hypothetical protein